MNNNYKMILNEMIFNDIIQYLVYKKQFKIILEISLISKQTFKIIQKLITHQQRQLRIVLGDKSSIISYIENTSNYGLKLLQFKQMEYLKTRDNDLELDSLKTKYLGMGSLCKFMTNWKVYSKSNSVQFKEYLQSKCPLIKRVHLRIELLSKEFDIDQENYDYTLGGFYSFDRIWTEVWQNQLPISDINEYDNIWDQQQNNDQNNSTTSAIAIYRRLYHYNFKYINNYNPRKFTLLHCDSTLIYNPFNLLNFPCIESLDIQHRTSSKFIKEALKSKTLRTLYAYFIPEKKIIEYQNQQQILDYINSSSKCGIIYDQDEYIEDSNDDDNEFATLQLIESGNEDEEKDIYFSIGRNELIIKKNELLGKELVKSFKSLSQNTTLRKLQINIDQYYYARDPTLLFQLLESSGNQTLTKLSLPGYRITRSKLLDPLINLPSITTLYFEANYFFQYNSKSFNAYLNHCNNNFNIQTFKCLLLYNSAGFNPILKSLSKFLNNNNINNNNNNNNNNKNNNNNNNNNRPHTLTIVIIFSISFNNFISNHNCEEIKNQLNQQLLNNKNNNNKIKLSFKYKVGKKEYQN